MATITTVFYVIKPKPELKAKFINDNSQHFYTPFVESNIWTSEEVYDGAESAGEIELAVNTMKIAFMLRLAKDLHALEDSLVQILGNPPIFSLTMFDKWWAIDRCFHFSDLGSTIQQASVEEIQQLEKSDLSEIDQWLEELIHRKSNPEEFDELDQRFKRFFPDNLNQQDYDIDKHKSLWEEPEMSVLTPIPDWAKELYANRDRKYLIYKRGILSYGEFFMADDTLANQIIEKMIEAGVKILDHIPKESAFEKRQHLWTDEKDQYVLYRKNLSEKYEVYHKILRHRLVFGDDIYEETIQNMLEAGVEIWEHKP